MLKAALLATLALSLGSCGAPEKTASYRDSQYGWKISYPASMTPHPLASYAALTSTEGVLIANSKDVRVKQGAFFSRFPPDGAAFALLSFEAGPMPDLSPPEARFPLSRESFEPLDDAPQKTLLHAMIANGKRWEAMVWFGPKASSSDKEKIWRIVESIRFPPQRPGTTSGEFYVLDDASHYALGSVTKFPGRESPDKYASYVPAFYLVHAPKGIYAIGWPPKFERKCHMGVDRRRMRFFCATRRGWWNRMGDALDSPVAGQLPDDALWLGQAKIGRDGQVLVGNWFQGGHYARYQSRFWP
jgi:hypothetical protein